MNANGPDTNEPKSDGPNSDQPNAGEYGPDKPGPDEPSPGKFSPETPSPFSRGGAPAPAEPPRPAPDAGVEWPAYPANPDPGPTGPPPPAPGAGYGVQPPYQPYDPRMMPGYGSGTPGYGAPTGYPSAPDYSGAPDYGRPTEFPAAPGYGTNPYEVNPYQQGYGGYTPYGVPAQPHPQAALSMILGIVGVALCPFVGIAGLVIGNRVRGEIDADPQRYTGRGMATAGFVLGILSIVAAAIWALLIVIGVANS